MLSKYKQLGWLSVVVVSMCLTTPVWAEKAKDKALATGTEATALVATLPESVAAVVKKYKVPPDELSVFIQEVGTDKPLVEHEIDTPRNPASTMKLLTTWSALKLLGPAWRWKTEVWTRGTLTNGVLQGDIILKGYGDPYLTYENFWQLVFDLRNKGLREIQGNIVIDNSYFDVPEQPDQNFDNTPERAYNAIPSAFMFNFQTTRFLISPDVVGSKIDVTSFPQVPNLQITNQMVFKTGACTEDNYNPVFVRQGTDAMLVRGNYSADCGQQFIVRLMSSPLQHGANAFKQFWMQLGGTVAGTAQAGQVQNGDTLLYTYYSAPLIDQIRSINKWSNNVMTRSVLLTLGAKLLGVPGTTTKGAEAIRTFLTDAGISTQGLVIDNGAGLSRDERITARLMGQLLAQVWKDPLMPEFVSSLPLLGQDGTLFKRFRRQDLRGQAHLKTGTLSDVTALSGFLLTQSGKQLIVVIDHHGPNASRAGRAVQDALLEWAFEQ